MFQSQKSTLRFEHSAHLGTVVDLAVAGYDIKEGVENKERPLAIADKIVRDVAPPTFVQLFEDSEEGQEIDNVIRMIVNETSYKHHDKNTIQMLIEDAERYNQQKTTDIAYDYQDNSVDIKTGYHEVMGQDMSQKPPEIDRVNPHRQNRFKPQ